MVNPKYSEKTSLYKDSVTFAGNTSGYAEVHHYVSSNFVDNIVRYIHISFTTTIYMMHIIF